MSDAAPKRVGCLGCLAVIYVPSFALQVLLFPLDRLIHLDQQPQWIVRPLSFLLWLSLVWLFVRHAAPSWLRSSSTPPVVRWPSLDARAAQLTDPQHPPGD